ncbi:alpha/beta hydrolase, partial [bacterium]|nr:alpha/beta hydrolase [bacterium]
MPHPVRPTGSDEIIGEVEYLGAQTFDGLLPRQVVVWLPPSYHSETSRRYPVLYMHDGHNAVDPSTSYADEDWQIDEVATALIEAGRIREFILVAPYATDARMEEYDTRAKGRIYLRFLTDHLKPLVDDRYRTLTGRDDTFIMGSSMGGHISMATIWHRPDVWSGAACLSPYFPPEMVADIEAHPAWPPAPVRIYVDNGGDDLDESFQPAIDSVLDLLGDRDGVIGPEWFRDDGA